jgi:hypothetical protein
MCYKYAGDIKTGGQLAQFRKICTTKCAINMVIAGYNHQKLHYHLAHFEIVYSPRKNYVSVQTYTITLEVIVTGNYIVKF